MKNNEVLKNTMGLKKLIENLPHIAAIIITFIVVAWVWNYSHNEEIRTTTSIGSKEMPLVDVN